MSKTERVYINTSTVLILASLLFIDNLSSENAIATPSSPGPNGTEPLTITTDRLTNNTNATDVIAEIVNDRLENTTSALENATAALTNATKALQDISSSDAATRPPIPPITTTVIDNETFGLVNATSSITPSETFRDIPVIRVNKTFGLLSDGKPSLSINTDRRVYVSDQVVVVFGVVTDASPSSAAAKVAIEVKQIESEGKVVYKATQLTQGQYIFRLSPYEGGTYNVTVYTFRNNNGNSSNFTEAAWTLFQVTDIFHTPPAIMMYIGFAFFAALAFLISKGTTNKILYEILRFVFLSGIAFSAIAIFIFTDLQVGLYSPLGLLIKPTLNEEGNLVIQQDGRIAGEWVINVGGQPGLYSSGIQIPVYVFIFGIAGGYLRYLYDTARKLTSAEWRERLRKAEQVEEERLLSFYQSLKDIALFILAPLLAVAVWFLLAQWETTENSIYTLAAVSFAVGLITDEIVSSLISFARGLLRERGEKEGKEKTQDETEGASTSSRRDQTG
jgi:hypothetical protein